MLVEQKLIKTSLLLSLQRGERLGDDEFPMTEERRMISSSLGEADDWLSRWTFSFPPPTHVWMVLNMFAFLYLHRNWNSLSFKKIHTPLPFILVIMFFDVREREKLRRLQALPPIRSTNVPISPSVWELWRGGPSAERSEFWKGDAKTWDVMLIVTVETVARKQWWDLATRLLSVNSPESRPWLCLTVLLQEG